MNSQGSPTSSLQARKLPFFPASFPDETLLSRVSRYHLLTGERKDDITFHTLFGQLGATVDFTELAPPSLTVLASLLPGDPMVQLGNILQENTLVPFVVPVIASSIEESIGSEFGDSKACIRCLDEDEVLVGVQYLHRSHQLPAVTACWKHGIKLIDACPDCEQPFRRPGKFLSVPITRCGCGWCVSDEKNTIDTSKAEHEFAIHAHRVLESRIGQTSLAVLVRFFQSQIEQSKCGFAPTGKVNGNPPEKRARLEVEFST
jgi:TniQ